MICPASWACLLNAYFPANPARSAAINDPAYIVELSSAHRGASGNQGDFQSKQARPWLAVYWKCCRTYSRIYRNAAGDAYYGQCPRCGKKTRATVGPGGVNARFFTAE